jgi:hypothetical protein
MTTNPTIKQILAAWRAWDKRPGAETEVRKLEDLLQAYSVDKAFTVTQLRIKVNQLRLKGLKLADALKNTLEECSSDKL